ncbi:MAG TPA: TIGR03435 family protein [Candidatus Acidoferrum sp.]|nr:TIGR03435 family protein [Candidatus Acidoferrum sp.]
MAATLRSIVFTAYTACALLGQQGENKSPAFDVASVKVTQYRRPAEGPSFSDVKIASPGKLVAINASLYECIEWAYQLKEYQFSGPDWVKSGGPNYDIEAKAPPNTPPQQIRLMLQTLLMDRFHLSVHRESRTLPVYDLVVAKDGPKLQQASADGRPGFFSQGGSGGVRMTSQRASMARFANWLSGNVDHPVIDKTDLTGFFSIKLEWAREGDGPSIFSAVQEQLGLRLQASKAPIDILIVDHAEKKPTAN